MQCISYPLHVHRIPSTLDADASEAKHADVETKPVSPTPPRAGGQPVWQHEQQKADFKAKVQNTEQDTTSATAGQYRALSIKTAANPLATLETLSSQVEQLRKLVLVLMLISGVTMLLVIRAALSPSSMRKRKS